jgi:protein O-GlcNAc transferase
VEQVAQLLDAGVGHHKAGRFAEAASAYRAVLALLPDNPQALHLLGLVSLSTDQPAEAERCFRRLAERAPRDAPVLAALGQACWLQDKIAAAAQAFAAVVELTPSDPHAHNNLGIALRALGNASGAELHHRRAIELDSSLTAAYSNLGTDLADQGRHAEAIECFMQAVGRDGAFALAHANLGESLAELGRVEEALAATRRAIELAPRDPRPRFNLAVYLRGMGQLDDAVTAHRAAIAIDPSDAYQQCNLLYTLNFHPGYAPADVFAEHRAWAQRHADPLTAVARPHTVDRTPGRRLRIGYVSPHFTAHAVNFFTQPILASHDHEQFEVFCYSSLKREDAISARLRTYADHWRAIHALSDQDVAELVRSDKIEVLVDLTGHIPGNRLLMFAHKPAPVQVTYIGYQNTTGMAAMDYRLTDDWSDPPGTTDACYTEKLVRLPGSFFCYRPTPDAPPVTPLPALTAGYVTFGSFNYFAKVTPDVLTVWARLLTAVENSRLVVLPHLTRSLHASLPKAFGALGVDPARVRVVDRLPRAQYLELISQVDIALDPFPFNGHTTTCDALWQGVPVVTLAGATYASRFGSSGHVSLGLEELIAFSSEEYFDIARRLVREVDRLGHLRATLRERMAASRLLDFAGFTRNLEAEYQRMFAAC